MAILGRLHLLLLHFPIALVIVAASAEVAAISTRADAWRAVAHANARIAAVVASMSALCGWWLATTRVATPLLAWHRWTGVAATIVIVAAALCSSIRPTPGSPASRWLFSLVVFAAAVLVIVASHLGGSLVWGVDFLRPWVQEAP